LTAWLAACLCSHSDTVVTVSADRDLGPVSRLHFGMNQPLAPTGSELLSARGGGIWDPEGRAPVEGYVALAKASGLGAMRWPGGCAGHAWNWRDCVGPVGRRPQRLFGLPEFMTWCRETGAVPFITVAAYWGTERDAADLVEYLNAPNNGANPNGDTDWAAVRAADGHGPPYGVTWFEFDAEAWHGDHTPASENSARRRLSAEDYAARYLRWRAAMRAVDPRIRLGAALPADVESWSRRVLEKAGEQMDFAATRLWLPLLETAASPDQSHVLLQAALAAGAQVAATWERLNALVEETCGRTDLPWAVTELGNHYNQEKPLPYRHTLAAALGQAELLNALMEPRHRVAVMLGRGFANQDWGMIQGYSHQREPLRRQALAMVYELYAQHFGDRLLKTSVVGDTWDFPGAAGVLPRSGEPRAHAVEMDEQLSAATAWSVESLPGLPQRAMGTGLAVDFQGRDIDYRHAAIRLRARPNAWYRVRAIIRTEGLTGGSGVCLEVGDGRKDAAAKPGVLSSDVVGTSDWTEVAVDYRTPANAEDLVVTARRVGRNGGPDPVSGKAQFRLYSVREFEPPNYGAVPAVGVQAARRKDGAVTVLLTQRSLDREQRVSLVVKGVPLRATSTARMWLLHGPWPWAANSGREELLRLWMPRPERTRTGWTMVLPAHSMAAIEVVP
jgi:alpha-N-arabinofuranosidase